MSPPIAQEPERKRKRKRIRSKLSPEDGPRKRTKIVLERKDATAPAPVNTTHSLLDLYFPRVWTLRDFLISKLPTSSKRRRRKIISVRPKESGTVPRRSEADGDAPLGQLLDETLVGDFQGQSDESDNRWRELVNLSNEFVVPSDDHCIGSGKCSQIEVRVFL
ncbi:MAG: hypothetical protein M1837_006553 [Sclerophora amabilis]|nr:MAG: hypothetical protein M1837_006553 [Sclerophora amabilis]